MEIKCKIIQANNADLRAGTDAANRDTPYFVNNTFHSLFSECTVSANGIKISNTNGNYEHKGLIETECFHGDSAENTWLVCQEYYYEDEPQKVDSTDTRATDIGERKALVSQLRPRLLVSRLVTF